MRIFGYICLFIIALAALTLAGQGLNLFAQPGRVLTKTFDADNMIQNYEWFRQQKADIDGMEAQIATLTAERDSFVTASPPRTEWTATDKAQYASYTSRIVGMTTQRVRMIQDYNARASQTNRSIFINPPVVGGQPMPDYIPL